MGGGVGVGQPGAKSHLRGMGEALLYPPLNPGVAAALCLVLEHPRLADRPTRSPSAFALENEQHLLSPLGAIVADVENLSHFVERTELVILHVVSSHPPPTSPSLLLSRVLRACCSAGLRLAAPQLSRLKSSPTPPFTFLACLLRLARSLVT
jgi:hypothetical protein